MDDLATKVDEAEMKLKSFEEHLRFLEGKVADQSNKLIAKDATSIGYQERVVVPEK